MQAYLDAHGSAAGRQDDDVFRVLAMLNQRAQRISLAVHRLLVGGFPLDALARARTLHEIGVVTAILGDYGRRQGYEELTTRYLDHEAIDEYSAAELEHEIGPTADTRERLDALRGRRDELVRLYGEPFGSHRREGWAAIINDGKAPSFARLEELAKVTATRPDYKRMSGEIHARAIGLVRNMHAFGRRGTITGPSSIGLGDPGVRALVALNQATASLLTHGRPRMFPSTRDLLVMSGAPHLIENFA